ncbi:oleandomycin transport system ATP-binding protein [Actinopolyspora lacussalsi subsp. righensis]|uniref:Oleandomycin transport system ATP-binding protein n=1 Tax=Actinopolyspora righensis TaxID=995060 RepID=A0A1I6XXK4_9ACTN|nr:ATP-binding cassette domain-containing protein [Actinopolyspora righensis]SFT42534.1 oleandomycin transport system ATP-binding protein [Actinopolyspora righensis]
MTLAVQAEGLVKRFGTTKALDGVNLAAPAGSILGVLGPNGAGKTTSVRILATLLQPDGGHATVAGHDVLRDPVGVRGKIGLTGQYASVDEELTGTENLVLIGRLLEMTRSSAKSRAKELLERFGLTDAGNRAIKTYSGGMRRRLDLAASLVGRPEVLYLDEPTTGLDPRSRNQVWDMAGALTSEGVTVLLTTQYLEEADQLADRISVIDHGRVVAEGRADELKRHSGSQTLQVRLSDPDDVSATETILRELTEQAPAANHDTGLLTTPADDPVLMSTLVRRLDEAGIVADELSLRLPSLDEAFLSITGKPATAEDSAREGEEEDDAA